MQRVEDSSPAGLVPRALLDQVVAYFDPVEVILFGSRAQGRAREGSDIDLLVLLDDTAPAGKLTHTALYEARRGFRQAVDLLACREGEYRTRSRVPGSLPHRVATEGVVVYRRSHDAHA